jgi:isocitrate dehydrogenase
MVFEQEQTLTVAEKANIANLAQKMTTNISTRYSNVQKIHKDVHSTFQKLGKSVDKTMQQHQEQANTKPPNWTVDKQLMNQIVAQHLYREGEFDVAKRFEHESNIQVGEEYKRPFVQMFTVLQELQKRNIEPALRFVDRFSI